MEHDLIIDNPRMKGPALKVLASLGQDGTADRRELERTLAGDWNAFWEQTPAVMVDILVRDGALTDTVLIDGQPYQGTLEDAMLDDAVADDAEARELLTATEKGERLAQVHQPASTIAALFDERPHYADAYRAAMWAASGEEGCTRAELEAQLNALPQLQPDEKGNRVYPQYFMDALETAGAIRWDGTWKLTEAGRAALDA